MASQMIAVRRLVAGLLLAASGACSSIPEIPIAAGSRVEVRLYDADQGIELVLANASHPDLAGVYSQRQVDGSLKLAEDRLIGQLLASLDSAGLAEFGDNGPPGELHGAASYLIVSHDGGLRSFRAPTSSSADAERLAFVRIKLVMNEYYRHVGGAQYIENPGGGDLLRSQRVKVGR
jgi:hypothetical protein